MQSPARRPAPKWSRLLPILFSCLLCLYIYWYGLRSWFQMDDFAWLSLHLDVEGLGSFVSALFRPLAQGTIRPWSERLFFLMGWHLFGMEAAPYRVVVFLTMFVNLGLLSALTRRLTGSEIAAFAAPVLWIANGNFYTPMSWTAAFNQVLCACFLLSAMLLWVRYTETGETRWYVYQWIAFLLGFGALELNLVYPALAALHALFLAKKYFARTIPMFVVSAVYVVAHRMAAPPQRDDTYRMYFDASVFEGLATFASWAVSAHRYALFRDLEPDLFYAAAIVAGAGLVATALWLIARKQWLPLFCLGWFLAALAPVLPLRNHRSDYYLTIPFIGLAVLGSYGLAIAWNKRWLRFLALLCVLAYLLPGIWMARGMSRVFYDHSTRVKHLVRSVAGAAYAHPGKVIVVSGVDNTLFWRAWYDEVFRTLGLPRVYLSQSTAPFIEHVRTDADIEKFFLADTAALSLLRSGQAFAYRVRADGRLDDVSQLTASRLARQQNTGPQYLDVLSNVSAVHVKEGWWPAEANHRWMSRRAAVEMRGPLKRDGELVLSGFCSEQHVEKGPVHLTVVVDSIALPAQRVDRSNLHFTFRLPLPDAVVGKPLMKVEISIDRPLLMRNDGRELGAAFGTFVINP